MVLSRAVVTRQLRVLLAAVCLMGGVLMLVSGAAQARLVRPYTGTSFGPTGTGAGAFGDVKSVAVDQSTGDVYVFDQGKEAIYKFTAAGASANFSSTGTNEIEGVASNGSGAEQQIAVDGSSGPDEGDIYLANNNVVDIYSAAGVKLGELTGGVGSEGNEACGVTVDPSGAVYVGFYPGTVDKYIPTANPVTNADYTESLSGLNSICNIAADGEGNVYAATYSGGVRAYSTMQFGALEAEGTLIDEHGATLAVDPAAGHVLINEGYRVVEFDATAKLESVAGERELESSYGVAVDATSGDAYAAARSQRIEIFGPPVVEPEATTEAPTNVTSTSGTINGSVNPEGLAATYQFEYGTSTSYGSLTPATPTAAGADSTIHHFAANLTGLTPSSSYHYRIVATNANGTSYGADETLYTDGPPTILSEAVNRSTNHSAQFEIGVDPNGLDTRYQIEYGTSMAYGSSTTSVDLGSEGQARYDHPEVTGLAADTTYHFRVVATNAEGTVYGADQVFSTEPPALISEETVADVGPTSVTLSARVNDYESATNYRVEYGTTSSYGSVSPSSPLPSEPRPLTIKRTLGGLEPSTLYHFRVVTEGQAGTATGADVTFTTEPLTAPSRTLPDGRAYERVSAAANADSDVYQDLPYQLEPYEGSSTELPFLVSPDGNAVAYVGGPSEQGGIGAEGTNFGDQYLTTRDAAGHWTAANIDPPSSGIADLPAFVGFSPALSVGFVSSQLSPPLAPGAPGEGYVSLYEKAFSTGVYTSLIQSKPEHRTPEEFGTPETPGFSMGAKKRLDYAGSSANLGHNLFMANDTLTPNAIDGGMHENNLYDSSGGSATLVNVLPDGSTEPNATFGGAKLAEDQVYDGDFSNYPMLGHDISEDGSRIFWTDLNTDALYARDNDTAPQSPVEHGKCTIAADACTVLIAEKAQYWNATSDGSTVLYTTQAGDLYEADLQTGQTTDLAPGGKVRGVVATSTDLSFVYFVAEAALAPGAEAHECEEYEGSGSLCNLYVVHIGEPTRFIGALSGGDNFAEPETYLHDAGDWQGSLADTEAEATPDGAHLLFTSRLPLTGYETDAPGEVFMYDYSSGTIGCLSCNPTGRPPIESAWGGAPAFLPVSNVGTASPHWMSDDGNRAFFDTLDALVPQDTNRQTDVYEWERDGSGSCADSSGCIYLLSDGTSTEGSYLIGASTSGDDVFLTTRDKLAPEDENETTDVYDVRANAVPPPVSPQCTGSGCQGVPAAPPIFATPPSVTYNGVGNFEPAVTTPQLVTPRALTRAQKLAKALKACRKKPKEKQPSCEAQARRKYGAAKHRKSSSPRRLANVRQSSSSGGK